MSDTPPPPRTTSSPHTQLLVIFAIAIVCAAYAYVAHVNDITINAFVCQPPVFGVSWVNMAAILVCLVCATVLLGSLLPLVSHLLMSIITVASIAYVVFMCVMGIMGPPETKQHVHLLANTLAQLPMTWLHKSDQLDVPIKHCYVF